MKKVVNFPFHGIESDLLAWLFENELIAPTCAWTRSPATGQLEPFYQQPFYKAAMTFTGEQQYQWWYEQEAALRNCPGPDPLFDAFSGEGPQDADEDPELRGSDPCSPGHC